MKNVFFVFVIGLLAGQVSGQGTVDIGIFGGAGTYLGDMTKINIQQSVKPAYGAFVRYNVNQRYGFRLNFVNGNIGATGEYEGNPWTFDKNVLDVSLLWEFNYFKYMVGNKKTPYSSYILVGLGVQSYMYNVDRIALSPFVDQTYALEDVGSEFTPTVPFGVGFKMNVGKNMGIALEGTFRKSLSDKLDDLDDPKRYDDVNLETIRFNDSWHNNDWTVYLGIHLVYKLNTESTNCAAYDSLD